MMQQLRYAGPMFLLLVFMGLAESGESVKERPDLRQCIGQYIDEGQISGAVTLVAVKGQVVHLEGHGLADIDEQKPMPRDAIFAIASMTKPVTATALMILQDEGKLSIDDEVGKYIAEFQDVELSSGAPRRAITIRDLLTHTSGVAGEQRNLGSLQETARQIAKRRLSFQPGERWSYSPGLTVCGRVIEVAAGQSYADFLEKRIFRPLQMTDTTFFPDEGQRKRIAKLYQPGSDPKSIEPATHWLSQLSEARTANPSGGLFSTASDMARFYQMVLNGGLLEGVRVVSDAAVRQMTSNHTGELEAGFTPGNGWGLGWCVVRQPQGVTAMLSTGSYGHGGLFGTQGWVDPDRKIIFVLMIQRIGFGNSDGADIRLEFQQRSVDMFSQPGTETGPSDSNKGL